MLDIRSFEGWFEYLRTKVYGLAKENGCYNENGELCVPKDDPWMNGGPVIRRDDLYMYKEITETVPKEKYYFEHIEQLETIKDIAWDENDLALRDRAREAQKKEIEAYFKALEATQD